MQNLQISTLIPEDKIQARIKEMGAQLTDTFRHKEVVAICILKGAFMFFSELIREINADIRCEFLGISSYQSMESSGEVRLVLDLNTPIENKHILLVEDIVDTGLSLNYLQKVIKNRYPKDLTTAVLVKKNDVPNTMKYKVDHVGFEIDNKFIVGYGMDCDEDYRHLPYIGQVENLN